MPNYENSKIYKLWSPEGDDIYIGSTTQTLAQRKGKHKTSYNAGRNTTSKVLFEKYNDVRIELIERFKCDNKQELNAREGYYIRTLACVNKYIPGRTKQQYSKDNKDKRKQYNEQNKDKIKEYKKQYDEDNKDKRKQYREDNKDKIREQRKQYREDNKDKIREYNKEYREQNYEQNKEAINARRRESRRKKKEN